MKKKIVIWLTTVCLATGFAACGSNNEVKVIEKDTSAEDTNLPSGQEAVGLENEAVPGNDVSTEILPNGENANGENAGDGKAENPAETKLSGFIFKAEGNAGTVSVTTDMDAAPVIQVLGEPDSYFEAPSCAFQGIDKIYTYSHFEINTYQDNDTDKISMILFLDDLVSTSEGICIGMTKENMENVYGTGYEVQNGAYVYKKDSMKLVFIISDGEITSIEYDSMALETS